MKYYDVVYYKKIRIQNQYSGRDEILKRKAQELVDYGWFCDEKEGGVISPDYSTIFYYRTHLAGQYAMFSRNKKKEFEKIVVHNSRLFEIKGVKDER